jgi:hypothetical protein
MVQRRREDSEEAAVKGREESHWGDALSSNCSESENKTNCRSRFTVAEGASIREISV